MIRLVRDSTLSTSVIHCCWRLRGAAGGNTSCVKINRHLQYLSRHQNSQVGQMLSLRLEHYKVEHALIPGNSQARHP